MKRKNKQGIFQIGFLHNIKLLWQKATLWQRILTGFFFFCVVIGAVGFLVSGCTKDEEESKIKIIDSTNVEQPEAQKETPQKEVATPDPTQQIYAFLQGPKSWGRRIKWSGEWGVTFYDGGSFGGFGCGLCCIANIYSSLSEYQCTPVDAYHFAKKHTAYGGGGAIDWGYMKSALEQMGFSCALGTKTSSYAEFQKLVASGQCGIMLVSSNNSKCYWKDTPGHYVTIFLYNEQTDKVFLADSGDPEHNRQWISLKKIYKSLKTASHYQYLLVNRYDKNKNTWKHKKANGNWVKE